MRLSLTTQPAATTFEHVASVAARGVPLREAEILVLLPEALAYVPGSATRDGVPVADPPAQSGSLRFTLGALDGASQVTFATRGAGELAGEHPVQALLRFTTALGRAERTDPVSNIVQGGESVVERISYTFSPRYNAYSFAPRFGSLQTAVDPRDGAELDRIATRMARHARAHDSRHRPLRSDADIGA